MNFNFYSENGKTAFYPLKLFIKVKYILENQNIITRSFPLLRSSFHLISIHVASTHSTTLGTDVWSSLGTDVWLSLGTAFQWNPETDAGLRELLPKSFALALLSGVLVLMLG